MGSKLHDWEKQNVQYAAPFGTGLGTLGNIVK
jgi:hypothetical protein